MPRLSAYSRNSVCTSGRSDGNCAGSMVIMRAPSERGRAPGHAGRSAGPRGTGVDREVAASRREASGNQLQVVDVERALIDARLVLDVDLAERAAAHRERAQRDDD